MYENKLLQKTPYIYDKINSWITIAKLLNFEIEIHNYDRNVLDQIIIKNAPHYIDISIPQDHYVFPELTIRCYCNKEVTYLKSSTFYKSKILSTFSQIDAIITKL